MTLQLAIIADDLTGALDAAAPFAAIKGGVSVATSVEALADGIPDAGVLSVSTRSREIPASEAAARVRQVLHALPKGVRLFKKIDSRMKGNIAAELQVVDGLLFVAPALPEFGRIVSDEMISGFGIEVPISVRDRLGDQADRSDIPATRTSEEMQQALSKTPANAILVGARGLAVALAEKMGVKQQSTGSRLPCPVGFVVGSTDPITMAQTARLISELPELHCIRAPSGEAPSPTGKLRNITLIQASEGTPTDPSTVAKRFARTVSPWLADMESVVVTGGATAEAVLDALDIRWLDLRGEAQPGLPLSIANGKMIATKSGGFGEPDTLLKLVATHAR